MSAQGQPPGSGGPDDSGSDLARDAWLSLALRHAPDAEAGPSAATRDAILLKARAAAREATLQAAAPGGESRADSSDRSFVQRLFDAWRWVSAPRVAGALASVMLATVVGLMWWDRPIEEALQRPEPPVPAAAPATTAAAPAAPAAEASATPQAEAAIAASAKSAVIDQTKPGAPAASKNDENRAQREADASTAANAPAARRRADTSTSDARAQALAKAEKADRAAETAEAPLAAAPAPAAVTTPSPAPAPAPAPLQERPAGLSTARSSGAAAPSTTVGATASSIEESATLAASAPPSSALRKSLARDLTAARADTAPAWSSLLRSLAQEPQGWHWQRDNAEGEVTPALREWLQRVDRAAAGSWSDANNAARGVAASTAGTLSLAQNGTSRAVLALDRDGALQILLPSGASARIEPTAAAPLWRALDDAVR